MTRATILETALKAITGDRAATHGKPEDSFELIAALWGIYFHWRKPGPLLAFEVGILMTMFKVGRTILNPLHADNYVDTAGYSGCAGDLATEGKPQGVASETCNVASPQSLEERVREYLAKHPERIMEFRDAVRLHRYLHSKEQPTEEEIMWFDQFADMLLVRR